MLFAVKRQLGDCSMSDFISPSGRLLVMAKEQFPLVTRLLVNTPTIKRRTAGLSECVNLSPDAGYGAEDTLGTEHSRSHERGENNGKTHLDRCPRGKRNANVEIKGFPFRIALLCRIGSLPGLAYWGDATQRYASAIGRPSVRSRSVAQGSGLSLWPRHPSDRPSGQVLRPQGSSFVVGWFLWPSPRCGLRVGWRRSAYLSA